MRLPLLLAILLLAACAKREGLDISIGTGGTGGVYYPYGGGLAELWTRHVPGVRAVAEVTGASVENVRLAHRGETVIGEVMGDVAYHAFRGEGLFEGKPQKILAMAVMYPNTLQVVTLRSAGIRSLAELRGRTVSLGAPGSGTAYMAEQVLGALGIGTEDLGVRRLSFVENANALRDGTIDVGVWCVAYPTSTLMDLATTHDIAILPFADEERAAVTAHHPFYWAHEIPAGVYRGVGEPVPTLSVWNVIICTADLPEQLVYDLARVLFDNNDFMRKIHPVARYTTPENTVRHAPIPLHPGAARLLRERGLEVPDRLTWPAR